MSFVQDLCKTKQTTFYNQSLKWAFLTCKNLYMSSIKKRSEYEHSGRVRAQRMSWGFMVDSRSGGLCPDKHSFDFVFLDYHIKGAFVCIGFEKEIWFTNVCSHILFIFIIFSEWVRCLLHCEGSACVPAVKPLLLAQAKV